MTAQEKYKKLNKGTALFTALKYVSISAPFIIIGAVNWKSYFTQQNGVSVGIGMILLAAIFGLSILKEVKKDTNKKLNGITLWTILFVFSFLFKAIINDMTLILGCGLVGQVVGNAMGGIADKKKELAKLYNESIIQAQAQKE